MKTSKILLITLYFFLFGFGKSYAQTFHLKTTEYMGIYIWYNDRPDLISGQFDIHYMVNIQHGNIFNWAKNKLISGEAVSQSSGEIFRVNYIIKEDPWLPGTKKQRTFHINLVGDSGTHIIMAMTLGLDQNYNFYIVRLKEKYL